MSGPGCMLSIVNTSQGPPDTSDAEQPLALLSEEPFIFILTMSTATRFRRPDSVANVGQAWPFL